jgi:hypothetical protein
MITVFKKKNIPYELILLNDIYFNKYTVERLDSYAKDVVASIDSSELIDNYTMKARFDGTVMNTDKLSSGCKTVLNIMYNTDKVFDLRECGENALDMIYSLDDGNVYCEYPMISFAMKEVKVFDSKGERVICDYDELKEWWQDEN